MFSNHPNEDASDEDHGTIASQGLFVTCGDAAELFDAVEEALDEMALLIDMSIEAARPCASAGRNHRFASLGDDELNEMTGIEGLVGDHVLAVFSGQESGGLSNVVDVPAGNPQVNGVAERIHDDMDLCGEPAA